MSNLGQRDGVFSKYPNLNNTNLYSPDFLVYKDDETLLLQNAQSTIQDDSSRSNSSNIAGTSLNQQNNLPGHLLRKERNRLAAERCRKKKTAMLQSLQDDCDKLAQQVHALESENVALQERLMRATTMSKALSAQFTPNLPTTDDNKL